MNYRNRQEILADQSLVIAPIGLRALALFIDWLLIILLFIGFAQLFRLLGIQLKHVSVQGFTHIDIEIENWNKIGIFLLKSFFIIIPTFYFTLTTYFFNGQTLAKKIFKIKIVSLYHHKIGFWHCLERSLGYVASTLELGLGFIQAFWNVNRMALHDKIAETIVIKKT